MTRLSRRDLLRDSLLLGSSLVSYDAQNNARPTLRISEVTWTADGWPHANL